MRYTALALVLATAGSPVLANEFAPAMETYLKTEVMDWASSEVLLEALRAQNATTTGFPQSQIDAMDTAWRAEVGAASSPTIDPVLSNEAAAFLREQVDAGIHGKVLRRIPRFHLQNSRHSIPVFGRKSTQVKSRF